MEDFFYFMNNRMRTDLRLKKIRVISHKKWNTVTNCYSVFRIDLLEKMVNLRLSFFEVFNSNFDILKVPSQMSVKIIMYYRKTLF